MIDEVPCLAMCFAMHEPTQNSEDTINEENPTSDPAQDATAEQPVDEATPASGEEADTPEASEEEEIDPWEALEIEAAKWKDQAVRTAAELDNYRKRMAREKLDAVRYGNQRLLEELLPVLDNFNMGMQAAAQEQGSMLYMGMEMVNKQLDEFLSSQNVEEIPATAGGDFDPNLHEALSQEASDEVEEGKIIRVVRKGYRIGERLLRPSNVIVAITAEEAPSDESTDTHQSANQSDQSESE